MTLSRLAIIAGEPSGDVLAAGLVQALADRTGQKPDLVGVGGPALAAEGLESLFDYSELSLMGIGAVLAKLPSLILRIRQTADAIIAARPHCLVIVDSPAFTHRVARRVRKALPDLVVVNYVCPTVWAWKPGRAREMTAYVDHVLGIFPFEPEVVADLGGPPLTYVGHRLMTDRGLAAARAAQLVRRMDMPGARAPVTCLLMPGSRRGEISRLGRDVGASAAILKERLGGAVRFVLPVAPGREALIDEASARWPVKRKNGGLSVRPMWQSPPRARCFWNWRSPAFRRFRSTVWISSPGCWRRTSSPPGRRRFPT